jgi:hypothetical protein
MHGGKSVDTTMGFTALDGLVMGTRCGTLDAGLVLHLIRHEGMDPADVETLFYQRSGLLGVSGISSDMRTLHESDALPRKRRSPCSRPGRARSPLLRPAWADSTAWSSPPESGKTIPSSAP